VASLKLRPLRLITATALALTGGASASLAGDGTAARMPRARHSPRATQPLARLPRSTVLVHRRILLGRSVDGRPIIAVETGDPSSARKVLVVGCIHGSECAGSAITERLLTLRPPTQADLWIIPNLNPDGAVRGSRGNAHGIDLNRNFPWHWQPLYGLYDSGPRPLSEPESRIAYKLILQLRPALSIWFHQHLDLVDESGGNIAIERRFATLVRLPLTRLTREPGSITSWENDTLAGTAFVVELPAGQLHPATAARFARAILTISR
jgi:murein peptide amidase A